MPDAFGHREVVDEYTPCAPGSLMRSATIDRLGLTRLARRDCEFYSVQIVNSGAWIRARVLTGAGRPLWFQPSTFTGSFVLMAGAEEGLLLEMGGRDRGATITVNWREPDSRIM
jgi:hypothetical protein